MSKSQVYRCDVPGCSSEGDATGPHNNQLPHDWGTMALPDSEKLKDKISSPYKAGRAMDLCEKHTQQKNQLHEEFEQKKISWLEEEINRLKGKNE